MSASSIDVAKRQILQTYHVPPDARLGGGMEAEVYAYGPDTVLKIYANTANQANLLILRDFYNSLDRQRLPYALPRIHDVVVKAGLVVTLEQRLAGTPLSGALPSLTARQMDVVMQRYLTAALALSQLTAPAGLHRYKLFDPDHVSDHLHGDWHQFLERYVADKLAQVIAPLSRDVPGLPDKLARLRLILNQPYSGDYRLIHGDFFPGNLLINDALEITALLDFGLMTMVGDPVFDIATGWIFFDMYDELKVQARERYLAILLERLGKNILGNLHRYVLIYSILSANAYSSTCADGHYAWCVRNLNNEQFWNTIC